jgi:hypothetical protein
MEYHDLESADYDFDGGFFAQKGDDYIYAYLFNKTDDAKDAMNDMPGIEYMQSNGISVERYGKWIVAGTTNAIRVFKGQSVDSDQDEDVDIDAGANNNQSTNEKSETNEISPSLAITRFLQAGYFVEESPNYYFDDYDIEDAIFAEKTDGNRATAYLFNKTKDAKDAMGTMSEMYQRDDIYVKRYGRWVIIGTANAIKVFNSVDDNNSEEADSNSNSSNDTSGDDAEEIDLSLAITRFQQAGYTIEKHQDYSFEYDVDIIITVKKGDDIIAEAMLCSDTSNAQAALEEISNEILGYTFYAERYGKWVIVGTANAIKVFKGQSIEENEEYQDTPVELTYDFALDYFEQAGYRVYGTDDSRDYSDTINSINSIFNLQAYFVADIEEHYQDTRITCFLLSSAEDVLRLKETLEDEFDIYLADNDFALTVVDKWVLMGDDDSIALFEEANRLAMIQVVSPSLTKAKATSGEIAGSIGGSVPDNTLIYIAETNRYYVWMDNKLDVTSSKNINADSQYPATNDDGAYIVIVSYKAFDRDDNSMDVSDAARMIETVLDKVYAPNGSMVEYKDQLDNMKEYSTWTYEYDDQQISVLVYYTIIDTDCVVFFAIN